MNVSRVKCSALCGIGVFISSCISSLVTLKQRTCSCLWLEMPLGRMGPVTLLGVSPIPSLTLPTPGADPNMVPNALPNLPMLFPASALLEAAAKNTHILFISILFPAYMQGCVCADVRLSAQACGCTSVGTCVCTHPCAYSNCAALFSVRVAAGGC